MLLSEILHSCRSNRDPRITLLPRIPSEGDLDVGSPPDDSQALLFSSGHSNSRRNRERRSRKFVPELAEKEMHVFTFCNTFDYSAPFS